MNRKGLWIVTDMMLALAVVSAVAVSGQDKYTLKLPDGLAFSDWKAYGDWQLIASAQTDDRMKVIPGNGAQLEQNFEENIVPSLNTSKAETIASMESGG